MSNELTPTKITAVTLYFGSATIERIAEVPAGACLLQLESLPDNFDVDSLQLDGGATVRVGDVNSRTLPRRLAAGYRETALDTRIAELEDEMAALDAEQGSNELALGYLRAFGHGNPPALAPIRSADTPTVEGTAQAIVAAAHSIWLKQHQLTRRKEKLTSTLAPLLVDRDRIQRPDAQVRMVTIAVDAGTAGSLRMRYQIKGPSWAPSYRAALDTTTGMLRFERLAQVSQASGEDWYGVHLRLSTGQPLAPVSGRKPSTWQVGIAPPPALSVPGSAPTAFPAPTSRALDSVNEKLSAEPEFDISVIQGTHATEFEVPGSVDLISGEQHLTLSLSRQDFQSSVRVRTTPASDAHAYLIAEINRPEGVWPAGPMQLSRDGAFVGRSHWTPADGERVVLSFGRDDLVQIRVEPEKRMNGSAGFIGGKQGREIARAYSVTNLHATPILIEVLEATPVSTEETVVVTQRLTPPPTSTDWQKQPGIVQWQHILEAGKAARFTADYTVTAPKDARLSGWR